MSIEVPDFKLDWPSLLFIGLKSHWMDEGFAVEYNTQRLTD